MKVCCFTGHRRISPAEQQQLIPRLTNEIEKMITQGVAVFRNGGALGFDTLAALCVLALRNKYPHIKLYIDVPHKGQEERWSETDRAIYHSILDRADKVTCLSESYYSGCMHTRNRHMVDRSDYVIAYVHHARGGAYYTAAYAETTGKTILYI